MAFFDKLADVFARQTDPPSPPERFLASLGTPSVSVAVLDRGSIESRCFSTVGDNEGTRFQAASISKPIAGTAVMRLVSRGKLSLDNKLLHVLPDELLASLGPPGILRQITLRHLLSHTAGFRTSAYTGNGHNLPEKLSAFPGQQFAYCGGNFAMLQIILETVFETPFADLVQEHVFDHLGMADSTFATPAQDEDDDDDEGGHFFARSWWTGNKPHDTPWLHHPELASGGVLVSAVQGSLEPDVPVGTGTETETERFLPRALAAEMLTEVQGGMALSWMVSRKKGHAFGHWGGNSPSFRCYAVGFADTTGGVDGRDLAG
ncbi:hypothetical protein CTA2_1430, partial [Colletotrichum tanaceti]